MDSKTSNFAETRFATRGESIAARVSSTLPHTERGKFIAIDLSSESFEIDEDDFHATEKLLARHPQAQIWISRVGFPSAYRMGVR